MSVPVFAVVGRPNKGKSSIVATLARDDSVYIDARAGSTTDARTFPMRVDGEVLYELVDTPGIQRARAVLDWLNQHCDSAAARPETVRKFVEEHAQDPHFKDEYELLKPSLTAPASSTWSTVLPLWRRLRSGDGNTAVGRPAQPGLDQPDRKPGFY